MIFVTGPAFSGKSEYLRSLPGIRPERCALEVQTLAAECRDEAQLTALADRLAGLDAVTASEVGCGVVPLDPQTRWQREQAGRLACLLAARAQKVVRLWCGIAEELK